jgi:hypothetical protein
MSPRSRPGPARLMKPSWAERREKCGAWVVQGEEPKAGRVTGVLAGQEVLLSWTREALRAGQATT